MTKHRAEEYEFSCAVIRGNERTLLTKADLLKVVETKQFNLAMNVLSEFGYGQGDFEKVLKDEQRRVSELVFSVLPEKSELELLLYPCEYHNIKVLLKSEFLGIDPSRYMTDGGVTEPAKLAQMIKDRNFIFMSANMKEAINEAIEMFAKSRDPQEIDICLDKACFIDMALEAERLDNEFLKGYVKLLIDILNINTFIRLRQINKPWTFFQKVFLDGGAIGEKVFITGYEEPFQQFADKLAPYGFKEVMATGAGAVKETGKYVVLEKMCDNLRIKYIRDAKYITAGIEPLAAFWIAKESEIKNLRMVLAGKLSGVSESTMKERLRDAYV